MSPVRDNRKRGTTGLDPRKAGIGPRGGAPSFTISGHTYADAVALDAVTVELHLSADSSLVSSTVSNGSGFYSFTVADNTTNYYVKGIKTGYTSAESVHTIVGGNTVDLTLVAVPVILPAPQPVQGGGGIEYRQAEEERRLSFILAEDEVLLTIITAIIEEEERQCQRLLSA